MPRYKVNRTRYPILLPPQRLTQTQGDRLAQMVRVENVTQSEVIRRCIDHRFEALFLPAGSADRTNQPTEQ